MKKGKRVAVKKEKDGSSDCNFFSLNDIFLRGFAPLRRLKIAEHSLTVESKENNIDHNENSIIPLEHCTKKGEKR